MEIKDILDEALKAIGNDEFDRVIDLIKQYPDIATLRSDQGELLLHEISNCFRSFMAVQPVIHALVKAGADIEARDDDGWTALHHAASPPQANLEALETLIELGANVNAAVDDKSPLHLAVIGRSRFGAVPMLLAHGANVHARDSDETTALHMAAANGLLEDVRVLVEYGAKLNLKTSEEMTPLEYATIFAWPNVIKFLREHTSEALLPAWRLAEIGFIHEQVERGNTATVSDMLSYNPTLLTAQSALGHWTPMAIAAREGRIDMLEVLVAHGGNVNEVNESGFNLVYIAKINKREELQQWLLDHDATPAHQGRKERVKGTVFSWNRITMSSEDRFIPADDAFIRLNEFLGSDPPPGYIDFMKTFGSGELSEEMYIYTPDQIIAHHKNHQSWLEHRFPPSEFPYENATELFTPQQMLQIVIAAHVNNADSFGFVRGEHAWYFFPRDGLIEYMGKSLNDAIAWLIRNESLGKNSTLIFKPFNPKS